MEQFLLSNNWTTDPYSQGYPGNAVAARFDIKGGPVTGSPYDHEFNFLMAIDTTLGGSKAHMEVQMVK